MVMLTRKLTMKVRTKAQREALCGALETSRHLYSAGLDGRLAPKHLNVQRGLRHDQPIKAKLTSGPGRWRAILRSLACRVHLLRRPLKQLGLAFKGVLAQRARRSDRFLKGFPAAQE